MMSREHIFLHSLIKGPVFLHLIVEAGGKNE